MDPRKLQFLQAIVGNDGAHALAKAVERVAELELAIIPRAITAWLEVMGPFGYDGEVPGIENRFAFSKNEHGFTGHIVVDGSSHVFEKASLYHVAGCMAVALGLDHERLDPLVKTEKLVKLGKGIDLLVKSRVVNSLRQVKKATLPTGGAGKKIKLPGVAAQPIGPQAPTPPISVQPTNQKQMPQGSAGTSTASPLPQVKATAKPKATLKVTKSQAGVKCPACGRGQFVQGKYSGCFCFSALAKSVKTTVTEEGYMLTFGNQWDQDAIETLIESIQGK